jgi:dTDP-glucose 4,6-dehydratase/UDP-glucuronate decarboxylase
MENSNVLVAGGAGFIGSNLVRVLIEKGHAVVVVDNYISGNKRNIQDLQSSNRFKFIEFDISKEISTEILKSIGHIDEIYHLASPASPIQYQKYPLETLRVNSEGTRNLLELAKENNGKFLYTSTSEVYGDPLEHPQKETYWGNVNSFGPRACYDEAKRFGEALIYTYRTKYDLDARIVRIFNTYGPHMEADDGRVISNFINQALKNSDITIYGDGTQTRSFCFVSDMVEGIVRAMETADTKGEVVNLGNPDERSVKEIAETVKKMTDSNSTIMYKSRPEDDPERRKPDISKAQRLLGWTPSVSFETGLTQTIGYFKNLLEKSS